MRKFLPVLLLFILSVAGSEIHDAVLANDSARVKELLKADPKLISAKDKFQATPLHFVRSAEMADFLLKNGADLNAKTEIGGMVLGIAISENVWTSKNEDDIDAPAPPRRKPEDVLALVKFLIAKGCDPNQKGGLGRTPLFGVEFPEVAKFLIEKGARVDARDESGTTPLHWAGVDMAEIFLAHGADVNAADNQGKTPLMSAAGDKPLLKLLIEKGAKVNCADNEGRTPLHHSANAAEEESLAFLIESKADLNAADKKGNTPLHLAIYSGACIDLLVKKGANINAKNKEGKTPLHLTAADSILDAFEAIRDGKSEGLEALLRNGADANATDNAQWTPLYYVTDPETIDALVSHKANVNARDKQGFSPLHCVSSVEQAETLLRHGADIDALDSTGHTPLMMAIAKIAMCRADLAQADKNPDADLDVDDSKNRIRFQIAVVKLLIRSGANLKFTDAGGDTSLHAAAARGVIECVKALIAGGAPVDPENADGATPLGMSKNVEIAQALIDAGADVKQRGKMGTPLHAAACLGNLDVVKLLIERGAGVAAKSAEGSTPLHLACWQKADPDVIRLLLKSGAPINARDQYGTTPLHVAAKFGKWDAAKLLLNAGADANAILDNKVEKVTPLDAAKYDPQMKKLLRDHGGKTAKELNAVKEEKDPK